MRLVKMLCYAGLLTLTPATAYAAEGDGGLSSALSTGAGVLVLVLTLVLLIEMLALRRLAEGSALAENISFAVLAVVVLAASVLVGWLGRFVDAGFTADQARLGADLLSVVAIVFFVIFFRRVRRAMSRFLKVITGQDEDMIAAMNADALESKDA